MKLNVVWNNTEGLSCGWESAHFEPNDAWKHKEKAELVEVMQGADPATVRCELVGGTEMFTRIFNALDNANIVPPDYGCADLFEFLATLYACTEALQVVMLYCIENGEGNDFDEFWCSAENDDQDCGAVYFAVSADTMDEAIIKAVRVHFDNVLLDFMLDAINWESIIDKIRSWPNAKYVLGGKCWAVYEPYNPGS